MLETFVRIDGADALLMSNAALLPPALWLAWVVGRQLLSSFGGFFGVIGKSWRIMRTDAAGVEAGFFEACIGLLFLGLGTFLKSQAAWDFRFFDRAISNTVLSFGTAFLLLGMLCVIRVFDRRVVQVNGFSTNWPWLVCLTLSMIAALLSYFFQR
jgi:hypothetical protein